MRRGDDPLGPTVRYVRESRGGFTTRKAHATATPDRARSTYQPGLTRLN